MSEIKKDIARARRFEFGRVHHYREAEALYGKDSASDECAVALGRLCIENMQFSLRKMSTDTLARLRRAAATSDPSFLRKLAIYKAYLNGGWDSESINLIYLAFRKDDYLAGYILSQMLDNPGDEVMGYLSLSSADRRALYLDCLQRSAMRGCLGALCSLGCYCGNRRQVEVGLQMLAQAAEGGCFRAFELLKHGCRSRGSDAYYVDMSPFLSHAKRLACDRNDVVTAGCLADYLADDERDALVDRVAALRFHRKSFRKESQKHTYVIFGDRRWAVDARACFDWWFLFMRDHFLLSSKQSHFPIVQGSYRQQGD